MKIWKYHNDKTESWTEVWSINIYYNFHVFCCLLPNRSFALTQYHNIYSISRYTSFSSPKKKTITKTTRNSSTQRPERKHVESGKFSEIFLAHQSQFVKCSRSVKTQRQQRMKKAFPYTCIHTFLACLLLSNSVKKREWTGKKTEREFQERFKDFQLLA